MSLMLSKRFWIGVVWMGLVLVGVNGICALAMISGVVDHHLTVQAACLSWGLSSAVIGWHTAKERDALWFQGLLIAAVVFLLAVGVSVVVRGQEASVGVWWKCALSAVAGGVLSFMIKPTKKKKRVGAGVKGQKRKRW